MATIDGDVDAGHFSGDGFGNSGGTLGRAFGGALLAVQHIVAGHFMGAAAH